MRFLRVIPLGLCLCFYGIPVLGEDGPLKQPVTVSVMPLMSSGIDWKNDLTAVSLRDEVLLNLVENPGITVVTRQRGFALQLESEIDNTDSTLREKILPSDYALFINLIPSATGSKKNLDVLIAVYEIGPANERILLRKIKTNSIDVQELGEKICKVLTDELQLPTGAMQPHESEKVSAHPQVVAVLPE